MFLKYYNENEGLALEKVNARVVMQCRLNLDSGLFARPINFYVTEESFKEAN